MPSELPVTRAALPLNSAGPAIGISSPDLIAAVARVAVPDKPPQGRTERAHAHTSSGLDRASKQMYARICHGTNARAAGRREYPAGGHLHDCQSITHDDEERTCR